MGRAAIRRVLNSLIRQLLFFSAVVFFSGCGSVSEETGFAGFTEMSDLYPGIVIRDAVIRIDTQTTYQRIRGFGVSGAWWTTEAADWPEDKKKYLAALLFDKDTGIGLSMYRYNLGAGGSNGAGAGDLSNAIADPWRAPNGLEIAPGVFDQSRDPGGLWFLKAAQDAGVRDLIGFVNSPPARFTKNNGVAGAVDGLSNIDLSMYRDFSRYLVNITRFLREHGYMINWLSPLNEPDINWNPGMGQEGCSYSPGEAAMLLEAIRQELDADGLPVKLSAGELCGWGRAREYIKAISVFPEMAPVLYVFSIHRYQTGPEERIRALPLLRVEFPMAELWMSEWTQLAQGRDTGMASALVLANAIHDDLTEMNASSWQYWIAVSKYDYHDGLVYVSPDSSDFVLTRRLWVMGNYSRFIRPGFVRIAADCGNESLRVSAYMSGTQVVAVCINNSREFLRTRVDVQNSQTVNMSGIFRTSDFQELSKRELPPNARVVFLHPQSVTTIIMEFE